MKKKVFCGPSKIFKNISWPTNICSKYFMTPTKTLQPPSYILNVQSLIITIGPKEIIGDLKNLWT